MEKKNYLKKFGALWIVFSLVFLIPLNSAIIFAEETTTETNDVISNICAGGSPNVKDSLLMSIVTMCLPGILEKTQEWKEIKCQTAVCYYDAIKNNLDPTKCIKEDSFLTCNYIVGDILSMPGLNILDYLRDIIANIIANPKAAILSVATKIARKTIKANCYTEGGSCGKVSAVISIFLVIIDSTSLLQQLRDIFNNEFFPSLSPNNSCDRLADIKNEMDEILK